MATLVSQHSAPGKRHLLGWAAVVALAALALGAAALAVSGSSAGWACPSLPGCRPDTFWPSDRQSQTAMLYRLVGAVALLPVWWLAALAWRSEQPRAVRFTTLAHGLAQLAHLVVGVELVWDLSTPLWLGLLLATAGLQVVTALGLAPVVARAAQPFPDHLQQPVDRRAVTRDLVALTKPRIISLLLVTTLAAMLLGMDKTHPLSWWLVLWTMVGGYLAAGGANAINMYIDRDVDALMGRTSRRPLPSSRLQPVDALLFGLALNVLAFVVLAASANLLTAVLAVSGSVFYVLIYTRILKRTTDQNIVIGGAAGAIPPMVGWAAVRGNIDVAPLLLFAIIFYWTPPHFWALALLRRADYARAGIPMLPVAKGEAETKLQIVLYSVLMVAISVLPAPLRVTGPLYLLLALLLGARFMVFALRLFREPGTTMAWPLYKYSLLYLALLFGALVLDHLVMLSLT